MKRFSQENNLRKNFLRVASTTHNHPPTTTSKKMQIQNNNNNRPVKLITRETASIISQYPEIEFLEAGHTAEWLAERKDQLLTLAHEEKIGSSLAKAAGIATVVVGAIFHAASPLAQLAYYWALQGTFGRKSKTHLVPGLLTLSRSSEGDCLTW